MAIQLTTYYKKTEELGAIELAIPADAFKGWTLNGVELNVAVAEYLIRYGIKQSLADSIASAKTVAEAQGLYQKRRDAMLTNTIGVRESGGIKTDDDPALALAIKNAKAGLMAIFDTMLLPKKAVKMIDYTRHEKIGKYFKVSQTDPAKAAWIDEAVVKYIRACKAKLDAGDKNGKDYLAEAEATLNVDTSGIDFDI